MSNEEKKEKALFSQRNQERRHLLKLKKKKILRQFLALLLLLIALVIFAIESKVFQKFLIEKVGVELLELTGVQLEMKEFELTLFPPRISARQIHLLDLRTNTFEIELADVKVLFNVVHGFSGQSVIKNISIGQSTIRLNETTQKISPLKINLPQIQKMFLAYSKVAVFATDITFVFSAANQATQVEAKVETLSHQPLSKAFLQEGSRLSLVNSQLVMREGANSTGKIAFPKVDATFNGRTLAFPLFRYFVNDQAGEFQGTLSPVANLLLMNVKGSLPAESAHFAIPDLGSLAGQIHFASKASIDFSKNLVGKSQVDIDYQDIELDRMTLGSGKLNLNYHQNILRIKGMLKPTLEKGHIALDSKLNLKSKNMPFTGNVSIDQISLQKFLNSLDLDVSVIDILVNGESDFKGTLSPISFSASPSFHCQNIDVIISPGQIIRASEARLISELSLNEDALQIKNATIFSGNDKIAANAWFDFKDSMSLRFQTDQLTLPPSYFFGKSLSARVERLTGFVGGKYENITVDISSDVKKFQLDEIHVESARGQFLYQNQNMKVGPVYAVSGSSLAEMTLTSDFNISDALKLDIAFDPVDALDFKKILPDVSLDFLEQGIFAGNVSLVLDSSGWTGSATIEGRDITTAGFHWLPLSLSFLFKGQEIWIEESSDKPGPLALSGVVKTDGSADISATLKEYPISHAQEINGTLSGIIEVHSNVENPISLQLSSPNLQLRGISLPDTQVKFALTKKNLEATLDSPQLLAASFKMAFDTRQFASELSTHDLNLARALAPANTRDKTQLFDATLTTQAAIKGIIGPTGPDKLTGFINIEKASVSGKGFQIMNETPHKLIIKDNTLYTTGMNWLWNQKEVQMLGSIGLDQNINLSVRGIIPVATLIPVLDENISTDMELDANINVRGPLASPIFLGTAKFHGNSLTIKDFNQVFYEPSIEINLSQDKIIIDKASVQMGEGEISASGIVTVDSLKIKNAFLGVTIDNAELFPAAGFELALSGPLEFTHDSLQSKLSGQIEIERVLYKRNVNWKTDLLNAINAFKKKTTPEKKASAETSALPTTIDLTLSANDTVNIDNNLVKAFLGGKLKLTGDAENLGATGDIHVSEGLVFFRGHNFDITKGNFKLTNPKKIQVLFEVLAQTEIEEKVEKIPYTIYFNATGSIDNFTTTLTSDPFLDDPDILTLIEVGVTQKSAESTDVGKWEAASVITGSAQELIESELASKFKFIKTFQIVPSYSDVSESVQPFLLVTSKLSDELAVNYRAALENIGEQSADLEYSLTPKLSFLADWKDRGQNKLSEVGLDFKLYWDFY